VNGGPCCATSTASKAETKVKAAKKSCCAAGAECCLTGEACCLEK
jgi:hypothetical protein